MTGVYDFRAVSLQGEEISLSSFRGSVLLVVNTACKCMFAPQYEGLESLYQKYQADGFAVLGFPCNQFGEQEPGDAAEIGQFCRSNYGVRFPMFAKIDVNGPNAHPLYRHLTREKPGFLGTVNIKWNFTKFLIDRAGSIVGRYSSLTPPARIESRIRTLLKSSRGT